MISLNQRSCPMQFCKVESCSAFYGFSTPNTFARLNLVLELAITTSACILGCYA